jgi:hypothetical protein
MASPAVTPTSGPVDDGRVESARADLAQRYGYDPATIVVERVESVIWPSAGLGCPDHQRSYDPTPVPGYRIVLRVVDLNFKYHGAADDSTPFLCQFLD